MIFVNSPVREDNDVRPVAIRLVNLHKYMVNCSLKARVFIVHDRDFRDLEARDIHASYLHQIRIRKYRIFHLQNMTILRLLIKKISLPPDVAACRRHNLLTDRINRRVCNLRKSLLKEIEHRLMIACKSGYRNIYSHCRRTLGSVFGHIEYLGLHGLIGITERLLHSLSLFFCILRHPLIRDFKVLKVYKVSIHPLTVRLSAGIVLLYLLIVKKSALHGIYEEHLSRMQTLLHDHPRLVDIQNSDLGGEYERVIVHNVIPGRSESVSVEHRSENIPVRKQYRCRAVPRLHHSCVILIEIPLLLGHDMIVCPRLGNEDQCCQRERKTAHHEKLQCVVEHCRIRSGSVYDRKHLQKIIPKEARIHRLLPREHLIGITLYGIDLSVVNDKAVRMRPLPTRVGVRRESRVHRRYGGFIILILQIVEERSQLVYEEHSLVNYGPARKRHDICAVVALLEHAPCYIKLPVEIYTLVYILRSFYKRLLYARHTGARRISENIRIYRHIPPSQEFHSLLLDDHLKHFHRLISKQLLLRKKYHSDSVIPLLAQKNTEGFNRFRKELV